MPPEEVTTTQDLPATSNIIMLDDIQYQTIVQISERTDLLTNRVEVLVLFNIVLITILIFSLMRSKS